MSDIIKVIPAPAGTNSTSVLYVETLEATVVDKDTAQTLTNKTLTTPTIAFLAGSLSAAGGNIATATAITASYPALVRVIGANGTNGIQLPVAVAGARYIIVNPPAAAAALKVYPQINSQINEAGSNAALTMSANTTCELVAYNTTMWYSNPKVPS